jgi:soluble lytic murein transglycosylase-like protein
VLVHKTTAFLLSTVLLVSTSAFAATPPRQSAPLPVLAANAFPLPVPSYLASIITDAAVRFGVDPNLVAAMAFRESRFNPAAVSWRGAQGVMQLMPNTARHLGVADAFDARQNVLGGTKYLRSLLDRFNGDIDRTLAAYNAGPELVARVGAQATPEAVAYVAAVKQYYAGARNGI